MYNVATFEVDWLLHTAYMTDLASLHATPPGGIRLVPGIGDIQDPASADGIHGIHGADSGSMAL